MERTPGIPSRRFVMSNRHFPVHPNLRQLKNQAKDLLRAIRRGDPDSIGDLQEHHPERPNAANAKLADAQLALARSYGLPSWPRLVLACEVTDAICHDRVARLREIMRKHPSLLTESARGTVGENWGPPMSYAANLGRTRIIEMLRELGAADLDHAFDRACLQGELDAARQLYAMGARPKLTALLGPAETLSSSGMAFLLEHGALGALSALVAGALGTLVAYALVTRLMKTDWVFLPGPLLWTVGLATLSTLALGAAETWRALGAKPAPYLRNE